MCGYLRWCLPRREYYQIQDYDLQFLFNQCVHLVSDMFEFELYFEKALSSSACVSFNCTLAFLSSSSDSSSIILFLSIWPESWSKGTFSIRSINSLMCSAILSGLNQYFYTSCIRLVQTFQYYLQKILDSHKMFSIRKPCPHCKGEIPTFRKVTANSLN